MCWSDLESAWQHEPAPETSTPVRNLVLAALAEAYVTRRLGAACCQDCTHGGVLCEGCREDLEVAREYEAAYRRICRIGSDGAVLKLTGGLT